MARTIYDVIKMARGLVDSNPRSIVERDTAIKSIPDLDVAEELRIDAVRNSVGTLQMVSVDEAVLAPTMQKCGLNYIEVVPVSHDLKLRRAFYGYVDASGMVPRICYRDNLPPCWKRFTVAKELLHIYSETTKDSITPEATVLMTAAQESRRLVMSETRLLDDELFGLYLAIEVMLPWRLREQFNALRAANATTWQIAKVFMVPERIVSHFISESLDGLNYAGLSRRINESI